MYLEISKNMRRETAVGLVLLLVACVPQHEAWDIDYSPVYRSYQSRENDPAYTAPSVIGCVDDDLYNCNGKGAY